MHLAFSPFRWVPVGQIKPGCILRLSDGTNAKVERAKVVRKRPVPVVWFTIVDHNGEKCHTRNFLYTDELRAKMPL